MKTKAIVFDKDGTLIDYSAFWYPVSKNAMQLIYGRFGVSADSADEMIAYMGVTPERTDIRGSLPRGDHTEIFTSIAKKVISLGSDADFMDIVKYAIWAFGEVSKPFGEVKPTCVNMRKVISSLKEKGIFIALITSDEIVGARISLDKLGVLDLFDEIIAHDGHSPAKPHPHYMDDFRARHGFSKDEVIMVGDTETDVLFAKNSGVFGIGVGKEESNRDYLASLGADITLPDISFIPEIVK